MPCTSDLRHLVIKRFVLAVLISLIAMLLRSPEAIAQTVISKSRIGGYAEDIAYISKGRLKNNIIIMDGYEVFSVENARTPRGPLNKLFDVKIPEIDTNPNGLTYIESESLFALNNVTQPKNLFLFDETGQFKGTRNIQYPGGYVPQHMEGMAYIPLSSPTFPDHIVMAVLDTLNGPSRIEVVRRDGLVVAEIFPNWPTPPDPDDPAYDTSFIGDVAYLSPNMLLVTFYNNVIWTIDFNGTVLAGPHLVAGANGFEGIVQMADERIAAVNFPQSLIFFDKNLNREPESDRNDIIGLNVNTPQGVAWNTDTNNLLIAHSQADILVSATAAISAVPTTLDSASPVVSVSAFRQGRRMTYLPAEHLIAMTHANNPRAIVLFNGNGTVNSQIDLSPTALGQNLGPPIGLTYIPSTNEFVVGFNGINGDPGQPAERRRLRVFSRTGTLVRTLDMTCTGSNGIGGLAYFDDPGGGGGRFVILGSAGRLFVTDLDGNSRNANGLLFREFNSRAKLGLFGPTDITAITTGPLAGAFAIVDNRAGEIVIFRLN
jgi:hypothetical protein